MLNSSFFTVKKSISLDKTSIWNDDVICQAPGAIGERIKPNCCGG